MLNFARIYSGLSKPGSTLGIGFPIAVFLLLAFPSTSYARDAFTLILSAYLWKDHQHLKEGLPYIFKSPAIWAGFALVTYVSLTTLWSQPPFIRSPGEQIRNGISVLLFWLAACLYFYQDDGAMKKVFWALGLGIVGNILGVWIIGNDVFQYSNRLTGYGILYHPIVLSSVAVIQITIGLHLRADSSLEKFVTITMIALMIMIVGLSLSRGPMLSLFAVIAIWIIYTPQAKASHKIAIGSLAGVIVFVIAYMAGVVEILAQRGASNRHLIWQESLAYGRQHLLIGWGWLNDFSQSVGNRELREQIGNTIQHPHSLLVSAFYYGGFLGLLTHSLFLAFNARDAVISRQYSLTFSLLAAVVLLTVTDTHTTVGRRDYMLLIFWLPTALIIMTRLTNHRRESHTKISPTR